MIVCFDTSAQLKIITVAKLDCACLFVKSDKLVKSRITVADAVINLTARSKNKSEGGEDIIFCRVCDDVVLIIEY